jgi:hypothetical protein
MNGALTMQIIDANTPDTEIEQNVAGDPQMGWRVKKPNQSRILAQYTIFWHAPNNQCYGDGGYKPNPPADTSDAGNNTPPSGSGDPIGGFQGAGNTGGIATAQAKITFTDGSYMIETSTRDQSGRISVTRQFFGCQTGCTPTDDTPGIPPPDPQRSGQKYNRLSWKELLRL